jgi:hypothetical protein
MAKVPVLYYSAYGHIEAMANAVAEGMREAGAQVDVKRVPELVPEEVARKSHYKLDQAAPIAKVEDLANTTPSSSAQVPGSGARRRRWRIFSTRRVACGRAALSTERSVARSRRRRRSAAARRPRCSRAIETPAWIGLDRIRTGCPEVVDPTGACRPSAAPRRAGTRRAEANDDA